MTTPTREDVSAIRERHDAICNLKQRWARREGFNAHDDRGALLDYIAQLERQLRDMTRNRDSAIDRLRRTVDECAQIKRELREAKERAADEVLDFLQEARQERDDAMRELREAREQRDRAVRDLNHARGQYGDNYPGTQREIAEGMRQLGETVKSLEAARQENRDDE